MKRFSIYSVFGRKGFGWEKDDNSVYVRLGFITLCITNVDIEDVLGGLLKVLDKKENVENTENTDDTKDLQDTIDKLTADRVEDKKFIESLEEEVASLEDVSDENEELKAENAQLEKKVEDVRFEKHYLTTYFYLNQGS